MILCLVQSIHVFSSAPNAVKYQHMFKRFQQEFSYIHKLLNYELWRIIIYFLLDRDIYSVSNDRREIPLIYKSSHVDIEGRQEQMSKITGIYIKYICIFLDVFLQGFLSWWDQVWFCASLYFSFDLFDSETRLWRKLIFSDSNKHILVSQVQMYVILL